MTTLTETRPAEFGGIWRDFGRAIERAVDAAVDRIGTVERGRLISLSIALPALPGEEYRLGGGDSCWLARDRDLSMYGSGAAARFEGNAAATGFEAACARWCVLDELKVSPVAWFSVPSATELPSPTIWVPRVLLRLEEERTVVTLSALRDATAARDVARSWLAELRGLLDPPVGRQRTAAPARSTMTPDAPTWRSRVRAATTAIAKGQLAKVVLARRLSIGLAKPVVPAELAERLAHLHPGCYVLSFPHGRGWVVAASPELLAAKRDRQLVSHALAGTAMRHDRLGDNARAASVLLGSAKERHEHAVVVDTISARMAEICDKVDHPETPAVLPLRFVQHLWTPVRGHLRPGVSLLDAVSHLHPTPAVLGFPMQAARDWLGGIGEHRDGLYSGVAGWVDLDGDGDGVVVLRSAYVEDSTAILWAGAGIVAESDPDAELAETELKLATMLEVLQGT